MPQDMMISRTDPELELIDLILTEDPCNIIVTMEHEAGCTYISYRPFLKPFGLVLLTIGMTLFAIGLTR